MCLIKNLYILLPSIITTNSPEIEVLPCDLYFILFQPKFLFYIKENKNNRVIKLSRTIDIIINILNGVNRIFKLIASKIKEIIQKTKNNIVACP